MISSKLKKQTSRLFLLLLVGTIYNISLAKPIDGVIIGINNKPIEGAFVYSQNSEKPNLDGNSPYSYSDIKGRFKLESPSQLLFIRHPAFHAIVVEVAKVKKTRIIKLQPLQNGDRLLSHCTLNSTGTQLRKYVRFPIDEAVAVDCKEDEGIKRCVVYQKNIQNSSKMVATVGRAYTFGFPAEQLILSSTSYKLRSFSAERFSGIDVRGVIKDKGIWRFVSLDSSVVIEYSAASEELSRLFDDLIKRSCVPTF